MRYPAASLLALVATPLVAQGTTARPDACTGRWAGAIATPGAKLAFDVDFTRRADGACNGDISIPAQGARDVALTDVRVGGDSVRFTIPGVPGTPRFSGAVTVDGSAVRGSFAQGGATLAFEMTRGPNRVALAREALTGIGPWLDSAITAWKVVGLGVGVVVDGETVYLAGHGLRDREKKLPVTPQTLFAIGSSSKAFTTFAMGALVDQGKLAWDQPVRGWLPWFRMHDDFATMRITPRDLVTHRSGLPRHDALWYNNTTLSREELVRHIAHLPLSADLREKFQYNNLMFLTAGYLVGAINGSSWEDGLRDLVLRPLGMTRTNFSVAESQRDADHSLPYRVKDDTVQRIPFRDISNVGPAGSINSSVEEMTKWITLHLNEGKLGDRQVIQAATLRDMYRPYTPIAGMNPTAPELGPMSYGLGWFVDTYRGKYRAQHGGNIDGFTAAVQLLPMERIGVVVLANQNGAALPELAARHIMDRLLRGERKDWSGEALAQRDAARGGQKQMEANKGAARIPGTKPSRALADFAGTYADSGYGAATIALVRDTLVVTYNGISAKLQHWHYDTFSGLRNPDDPTFEDDQFTFRSDARGRVDAMLVQLEPTLPPVAMLRQPDARLRDATYLAQLAGRYRLPTGQMVTISQRGTTLLFQQGPGSPIELDPDGAGFVLRAQRSISLEFQFDKAGKVTGFRGQQPGAVFDAPRVS